MKILIRVLVVIAIVLAGFLGTWAVLQRYENYKIDQRNEQQHKKSAELAAKTDAENAVEAEMSRLRVSYELARQECLKGRSAYDLLTPALKTRVAMPECGQPLSN